ncbi:CPBP family glutamic-type intramembrane protease [Erwiniaceae bacterium BAC15a-03b]|uniref:CPBP family glutamic-type intramembrane protease n=1 Tax=Winslowiella arboricola TaxID=2978220 RepID=A0A9J6PVM3_9GAMM|nr:CPBP family glutamic-type intramembrane protease [Winslowiella arboricola]MCU5772878.1 CPBP family glutamic-type intramembrane protease [Winslowiella arboricola]MCU5780694.1 CPBP family glutamic-type intramembrane protease [Winslowiella arboricola]
MWILLAFSLLAAGFNRYIGALLLLLTTVWAVWAGVLEPVGVGVMVTVALIALLLHRYRHISTLAIGAELLLLFVAINLLSHFAPGFNNVRVLDQVRAGEMSAPFSMYFNFDKALLPFVFLAIIPTLFRSRPLRQPSAFHWLLLILSLPLLLLIATAFGGLKIEPHAPQWIGQFFLANLFFVCLAEEALFRGYLQRRLSQFIGPLAGLLISALLFGICHLSGGALLVLFATLAGVIYGLAWMWTGRLWVATLFHFALNLLHLLFFTWPAYQP